MNHVFNVIWSHKLQAFVPVPERVSGGGKRKRRIRLRNVAGVVAVLVVVTAQDGRAQVASNALPTGGQITAGSGTISQSGNAMTVNQSSNQMIATWNTFNIGSGASVQFVQPSTSSVALNRVLGGVSQIMGSLTANGQVFLINPNGIVFGQGAQVDVGGVVASSLGMSNADFLAGRNIFSGAAGAGGVINQGTINAGPGGVVALIAPKVSNEGAINAGGGSVVLAAAEGVTLDFIGDGLVSVKVDQGTFDALVENKGVIVADGGFATMTAKSANALLDTVINNTGTIRANTLAERTGRIVLDGGDTGTVQVAGTLEALGTQAGQKGGAIDVTGNQVNVAADAVIDASGAAGGGTIRIGGGKNGKDADIANAKNLTVEDGATIAANATDNGNGGSIALWSDGVSNVGGSLSAVGGGNGKGGYVETSGHILNLDANLKVTGGKGGVWVIDPVNDSTLANAATYQSTLRGGTDVVNIVNGAIDVTGVTIDSTVLDNGVSTSGSLYLQANGHISLANSSITLGSGGNIYLGGYNGGVQGGNTYATGTSAGDYGISLNTVTLSTTGAGTITMYGRGYTAGTRTSSGSFTWNEAAGIGVTLAGTIALSGNTVTINGTGGNGQAVSNDDATAATITGSFVTGSYSNAGGGSGYGDNGTTITAGNGARGAYVASGAVVTITGTTSATINATGGNGGAASFQNYGGHTAQGGASAIGYEQDGAVAFNAPTATINGARGSVGSGSGSTYGYLSTVYAYNNNFVSCGESCTTNQPVQGSQGSQYGTSSNNPSGTAASYGVFINGALSNTNGVDSTTIIKSNYDAAEGSNGTLTASKVAMEGVGGNHVYTFKQNNAINKLSGNGLSNLYFNNTQSLNISTIDSVAGITTTTGNYIRLTSGTLTQETGANLSSGTYGMFTADTMSFGGGTDTVTGTNIGLRTYDTSRAISLGGSSDPGSALFLSDTSIAAFSAGISNLVIGGSTNTGTITVNGATFKPNTSLSLGNGNISLAGNLAVGAGKTLLLQSSGTVSGDGAITASNLQLYGSGGTFLLSAGKNNTGLAATNSIQNLAANTGTVDLINSGNLTLTSLSTNYQTTGGDSWDTNPFSQVSITGVTGSQRVYINTTGNMVAAQQVSGGGTYTTMNSSTPANMNDRMGAALVLVAGGHFDNNYGNNLLTAGASRWLVYSQTPETGGNSRNSQAHTFRYYAWDFFRTADSSYNYDNGGFGRTAGFTGTVTGLNGFLYSAQPTLTITPSAGQTSTYGNTPTLTGYTSSGWYASNGGDTELALMTGTARYSSGTSASAVGTYDISYIANDTTTDATQYLVPKYNTYVLGYKVVNSTRTNGLTIGQRAITITADAGQSKVYGDPDSGLTYAVTSGSLVNTGAGGNGSLSGSLAGSGGVNAAVGVGYNITQGTLANSNYAITYVGDTFSITARPITITVNSNQQKYKGDTDPALAYTVSYTGNASKTALITGDSLTGLLTRAVGEEDATYAISQGTLAATANYTITFVGGNFTIKSRPANTSSLVSVQTGITGTSTNNGGTSTGTSAQQVGAGTGSTTLVNAANSQVVFNNTAPVPLAPLAPAPTSSGSQPPTVGAPAPQTPPPVTNAPLTVSTAGNTSPMTLTVSGNTMSVDVPALANTAASSGGGNSTGLTLFVAGGQGVQAKGDYNVVHQGTTMTATTGSASVSSPTGVQTLVGDPVKATVDIPGAGNVPISVGISAEGVLVISMPPDAVQSADPQTTMLVGLALARQNLGTAVGDVKAVMITPAQ